MTVVVFVRMDLLGSETLAHRMPWSTSSVDKPVNNSLLTRYCVHSMRQGTCLPLS